MKLLNRILIQCAVALLTLCQLSSAIMPPAPPERYTERLNVPIPEGIKNGMPEFNPSIAKDLEAAAAKRPDNTDRILLILVEFIDHPADQVAHPHTAYEELMFSTGVIVTGSFFEYYQEVSYGEFAPAGSVTVWITAPHPYSYYTYGSYGMGDYPNNSQGLLEDCVNALDAVVDFSAFDADGDGYMESIFLVHAGPAAEETGNPNDFWSHAWSYEVATDDGVYTGRYSTEPEETMSGGIIEIGVFCHEYGHVLGLPDLYDTDGSSEGIGIYCLMASGSWGALPGTPERPTHMCAEMKRRLGWVSPIEVTDNLLGIVIPPAVSAPTCYKITHPTKPNEYFLIENRAKVGFDSLFRGDGGLAVWHVDQDASQQDETHRYVTLEQADGNFDLDRVYGLGNTHPRTNRGDAGDLYPGAASNSSFSFSTIPSSLDYDLSTDLVTITDIEHYGDSIVANVFVDPDILMYRAISQTLFDTATSVAPSNFNSDADSGEVVDLVVKLANEGQSAASVSAAISTSDTRVSVTDGFASYGPIDHGTYASNTLSPFRFEVLSADSDSAVTFDMHINADGEPYDLELKVNINRQKILVVLDNNGSNWSENLVTTMYSTDWSFDLCRTSISGSPEYDEMIPYHLVLWTTGSYFGRRVWSTDYEYCVSSSEIVALKQYLDNNGRLVLFSQDYLYDNSLNQFARDYLYVASAQQDEGGEYLVGDPSAYLHGFTGSSQEWTYYDYTDHITPYAEAQAVLREGSELGGAVMISYPGTGPQIGEFAASFCAFGVERLNTGPLLDLLSLVIGWHLTETNIDVPLAISPKDGDTVEAWTATLIATISEGANTYGFQVANDFEFSNTEFEQTSQLDPYVETDTLAEGQHFWRVRAVPADDSTWTAYSPRAGFVLIHPYVPGDADGNEEIDIDDVVYLIAYIFSSGPSPDPLEAGDADCSDSVDIDDVVYIVAYIFSGGNQPGDPDGDGTPDC